MIYQTLYDLIFSLFTGATNVAYAELVCTFCATLGVLALVVLPFVIVYKVITFIFWR